jgi:hypothetical protein
MEVLFVVALILSGLFILFACLEADTWTPVVFGVISLIALTVGLYTYLQTEPTTIQHTMTTDRLNLTDDGSQKKCIMFQKPVRLEVTYKKRWGSIEGETIYTVLGE